MAGMSWVYHITDRQSWNQAESGGVYCADTLETEGFIHCSTRSQIERVANARFAGRQGLVLLAVDLSRVSERIVFENTEGGTEPFPHIYGPIPTDAIAAVADFAPDLQGRFSFPEGLPVSDKR